MNTHNFFNDFINPAAHKVVHDVTEYNAIAPDAVRVKATTLYQIYKHNVFEVDGRLTLREFYRVAGQYLYYDKYVCDHGTEYYYLVVWNQAHPLYQATEALITQRVEANAPTTLDDLQYVVTATGYDR